MTGHRGAYLAALVAAVVVLLGSVTAVTVYVTTHTRSSPAAATSQSDGWGGWTSPDAGTGTGTGGEGWGWDGMGGMMNNGDGSMNGHGWTMTGGSGTVVSVDQARVIAQDWVDANAAAATLDAGTAMGSGYRFTITRDGQTIGWLWVDAATGRVGARVAAATAPAG